VVIAGVIKSSLATPATYDDEVLIEAKRDVALGGSFTLAGSLSVTAGRDISAPRLSLMASASGQHLLLGAGGNIDLGTTNGTGGVVMAADTLLTLSAAQRLSVGRDAVLYSEASESRIELSGGTISVLGGVNAGATYNSVNQTSSWTGKNATIDVRAGSGFVLGSTTVGGKLWATGRISVNGAPDTAGVGIGMSASSSIWSDATAKFNLTTATWDEAAAGADGGISLSSDGDIWLRGQVSASDVGADISIASRAQLMVDGLVSADDQLSITAGIHQSGIAVLVETLVLDASNNYVSGGTLDTAAGGAIRVTATDSIYVKGVLGQRDLGEARVGLLRLQSTDKDVFVYRNINVRDTLEMDADNIRVRSGAYVYATGVDSQVFMKARTSLEVSGSNAVSPANPNDAIIMADKLIHLLAPVADVNGIISAGLAGKGASDGRILVNVGQTLTIAGGALSSNRNIELNAGVDMAWSRSRLEGTILRSELIGGNIVVSGQALLTAAEGAIVLKAGGDVTLDAAQNVSSTRSVSVESYKTVAETLTTVVGYEKVALPNPILVPVVTWETTQITEVVEYKEFKVGSQYTTMDVVLTQVGYYNPLKEVAKRFVEVLAEGVDYTNAAVNWAASGANAPGNDYRTLATYLEFT
jgi:hypothetical protein